MNELDLDLSLGILLHLFLFGFRDDLCLHDLSDVRRLFEGFDGCWLGIRFN